MNSKWLVTLCLSIVPSFLILGSPAAPCYAQETRRQKPEQNPQQNQYRDQSQDTAQQQQQQSVTTLAGKVSQKNNRYFLEDPVHRNSYLLADIWEVKRFLGKKVRVTGILDQDRNIFHVKSITPVP
jgi:hypothetical protein